MNKQVLRVLFQTKVYSKQGRFQVGRDIARLLNLRSRQEVSLVIRDARSGRLLFGGQEVFKSNFEVYSDELDKSLHPGQKILVEVSSPK